MSRRTLERRPESIARAGLDENGFLESRAFPGLRLDDAALLAGALAAVLDASGTETKAHAAFTQQLGSGRGEAS